MTRFRASRRLAIAAAIATVALFLAVPGVHAADATASITAAGGTTVYSYPQIGVVIARSSSSNFRTDLLRSGAVQGAAATAGFATHVSDGGAGTQSDASSPVVNTPVADTDSLSGLQWDMRQIHTPEAHAITGGSPSVVVGDIDTGLDYTHPDLAPNFDASRSVNCVNGVPDSSPNAWL